MRLPTRFGAPQECNVEDGVLAPKKDPPKKRRSCRKPKAFSNRADALNKRHSLSETAFEHFDANGLVFGFQFSVFRGDEMEPTTSTWGPIPTRLP